MPNKTQILKILKNRVAIQMPNKPILKIVKFFQKNVEKRDFLTPPDFSPIFLYRSCNFVVGLVFLKMFLKMTQKNCARFGL